MKKGGLAEKAGDVVELLRPHVAVMYDHAGSIGRRYRRQDEIGTPLGITIDFQTLDDHTVTVRDRDTTRQERVALADLVALVRERTAPPRPTYPLRP